MMRATDRMTTTTTAMMEVDNHEETATDLQMDESRVVELLQALQMVEALQDDRS